MAFFMLAALGVVGFVQQYPTVQGVLFGAGGLLMLYFAYGAAIGARATFAPASVDVDERSSSASQTQSDHAESGTATDPTERESTGFRRAFVLALTNPYQILFWLTVGVGLLDPGSLDVLAMTPYVGEALTSVLVVETGSAALVVGFFGVVEPCSTASQT